MSVLLPILHELHDRCGVHRAVDGLISKVTRHLGGDIAISIRLDALRMRSFDNFLHRDGQEFCECPEIRGRRLAREVKVRSRADWNRYHRPQPKTVSRRFLERFELPDRDTVEWISHFPAHQHLAIPLLRTGEMHGEIVVPIQESARGADLASRVDAFTTKLTPLWLLRNFLRDRFESEGTRANEGISSDERWRLARLLDGDFPDETLGVRDRVLLERLRAVLRGNNRDLGRPGARIVLAAADPLVYRGIADILDDDPAARAAVVCYCGLERVAARLFLRFRPDVLVVDIPPADSAAALEVIRRVSSQHEGARILALLPIVHDELLAQLTRAGAAGAILRDRAHDELSAALDELTLGRPFFGVGVLERVGARLGESLLTPREMEVLRLASRGRTNREVGEVCGISERTVRFHIENAMPKLSARSRREAIRAAIAARLV